MGLATWMDVDLQTLTTTLTEYHAIARNGSDPHGRVVFNNANFLTGSAPYYVGVITPVLHYCMGGVRMGPDGAVKQLNGETGQEQSIPGLYAAGEISGGIHGKTRLGGNALTECVVFGRTVGMSLPV